MYATKNLDHYILWWPPADNLNDHPTDRRPARTIAWLELPPPMTTLGRTRKLWVVLIALQRCNMDTFTGMVKLKNWIPFNTPPMVCPAVFYSMEYLHVQVVTIATLWAMRWCSLDKWQPLWIIAIQLPDHTTPARVYRFTVSPSLFFCWGFWGFWGYVAGSRIKPRFFSPQNS